MIDFIPLEHYFDFFIYGVMLLLIFTLLHITVLDINDEKIKFFNLALGGFTLVLLLLYIGLRPVSGRYFTDMKTYAYIFDSYRVGGEIRGEGDLGFAYFTYYSAKLITRDAYFFVCAVLYIVPLFWASKRWFPNHYFFAFLMLICSFSFYTYGVNGIRNGIATSFVILGLSYDKKYISMAFWFMLGVLFHKTMLLPVAVFVIASIYKNIKAYFIFWVLSIILSSTMGGIWIALFTSLGFGDNDRMGSYLTDAPDTGKFSSVGFRWDFLIYSAIPIIMGYIYVYKMDYKDSTYHKILSTYLLSNAFWIMIIRANFSNRFAYLSWFLMAVVIFYPVLKTLFWKDQFKKIGYMMVAYYMITYILLIILG